MRSKRRTVRKTNTSTRKTVRKTKKRNYKKKRGGAAAIRAARAAAAKGSNKVRSAAAKGSNKVRSAAAKVAPVVARGSLKVNQGVKSLKESAKSVSKDMAQSPALKRIKQKGVSKYLLGASGVTAGVAAATKLATKSVNVLSKRASANQIKLDGLVDDMGLIKKALGI